MMVNSPSKMVVLLLPLNMVYHEEWWLYHQYQEADEVGITPILG